MAFIRKGEGEQKGAGGEGGEGARDLLAIAHSLPAPQITEDFLMSKSIQTTQTVV